MSNAVTWCELEIVSAGDASTVMCANCGREATVVPGTSTWRRCVSVEERAAIVAQRAAEQAEAETRYAEVVGPNLVEKAAHYAAALLKWRAAGYPTRTDEEVAAIVETCKVCEKWNVAEQACNVCGCGVNQSKWALKNKARMGSEVCPLGKWPEAAGRAAADGGK